MKGDSTLFARTEEVIEAWKFLSPVINCWKNEKMKKSYSALKLKG